LAVIVGRATIPDIHRLRIEGSGDLFVIEGETANQEEKMNLKDNLKLIKSGSVEKCSFTTQEEIEVRSEPLRIVEVSISERKTDQIMETESSLGFRIVLVPVGVFKPAEELL